MAAWQKVAAVSGFSSVALAAYGAHALKTTDPHFTLVWQRANSMHIMGSLLLAISPATKRPNLVGGLAAAGVLLFSGSCYACALTEDRKWGKGAPLGGVALMAAWLALF
ncbi:transmembrane protein [Raphidocelis subcapitata]|uniref:Transmembrane protein n=1 Tax=Raphidocelis subcapitata TaxID=307507 RepID=A0A2V0NLN2_9CHLO|nr:transmembrane protein [Raphidocelis subcapitata]|eukprot:GBF88331.1 transmembrane protein [Raphidocelis subcapitata]